MQCQFIYYVSKSWLYVLETSNCGVMVPIVTHLLHCLFLVFIIVLNHAMLLQLCALCFLPCEFSVLLVGE